MRSRSWSYKTCLSHFNTWALGTSYLSLGQHLSPVHILLSTQRAAGREESDRDIIISHPGLWCEAKRVVHTSTPLDRCLCTDTGAGGLARLFWSTYLQFGRRTRYPGRYSDLQKKWMRRVITDRWWSKTANVTHLVQKCKEGNTKCMC